MTRHIFKLVWNRKRSTGLILVEILICFLVLCGILSAGLSLGQRWQKPLGFDYENVWSVDISGMDWQAEGEELAANQQSILQMLREVRNLPEVEATAASTNTPFSGSSWLNSTWINGVEEAVQWTMITPDLPDVLKLELLYGRWIDDTDPALEYRPVVINQRFARAVFGLDDAVGQDMPVYDDQGQVTTPEEDAIANRIVGVMDDYRRHGVTREDPYVMFVAVDLGKDGDLPTELLVRVRPGTTAAVEESLVRTMQQINPHWSYKTTLIEDVRRNAITIYVTPLLITAVIAVFLITMVGLGLVGVLWLNVTRRTSELGLRRALGASTVSVRGQILGELWALTGIAVITGTVIFLQLPLFGANFGLSWPVFLGGAAMSAALVYGFVTFCGLYPTWLATRILPATALQYE